MDRNTLSRYGLYFCQVKVDRSNRHGAKVWTRQKFRMNPVTLSFDLFTWNHACHKHFIRSMSGVSFIKRSSYRNLVKTALQSDRQMKNQSEIEDLPKFPHLERMDKQLHHHSITTVFCGIRLIIHVHPDSWCIFMDLTQNVHNAIYAQTQVYLKLHGWVITPPQHYHTMLWDVINHPCPQIAGSGISNYISGTRDPFY